MQDPQSILKLSVIWRRNKYVVEMNSDASVKELGHELQKLTDVKADTMRFIVSVNKGSKLLLPFSDDHSSLSLHEASVIEGKPIRMMGVSEDEVDKVLQNEKVDLRIVGFDEEEKRLRQRMLDGPHVPLKLPQGPYTFCDFRTLQLPGVELNPPASEALKRMHMLAADPGIVAIMNQHRWRVGIMTELAPVGYVGISPKCLLGFNKNQGEEISLRLRTDDLKGFRKYESIKKTLLHELAHMVYTEHDANFYALDKQLNQEAAALDWTRTRGQTLSEVRHSDHYEENFDGGDVRNFSQKLGGNVSDQLASARASSVAAAYRRLASASVNSSEVSKVHEEPDSDDSGKQRNVKVENFNESQHSDNSSLETQIREITSSSGRDNRNTGLSRIDIRRQNVYTINRDVGQEHVNISNNWDFDCFFNLGQPEWDDRRDCLGYEEVFDEVETLLRYNNGSEGFLNSVLHRFIGIFEEEMRRVVVGDSWREGGRKS
ncbi:hypothetical protein JRO89_XS01G0128300 [Xanthoceras sorbifolium]|uniref:WLM domain-containing protein n=1 Tax=Xanthoceras sorbifolium TaxID=99658 RepID=A0ABQ8IJ40_9ROSI|nr:hypothetical protein JRO89_XS01G0128300 [Xanthoceras sorbifolium]